MYAERLRCLDYARHDRRPERSRGTSLLLFSRQGAKYAKKIRPGGKPTTQNSSSSPAPQRLCARLSSLLLSALRLGGLARKIPPSPQREEDFGGSRAEARRRREDSAWESGPHRNGCGPSQFVPPRRRAEDSAGGKPTPPNPPWLRASAREISSLLRFAYLAAWREKSPRPYSPGRVKLAGRFRLAWMGGMTVLKSGSSRRVLKR